MIQLDFDELRRACEAATQGEWKTVGATLVAHFGPNGATICAASEPRADHVVKYVDSRPHMEGFPEACANAEFIATFNPALVKQLLDLAQREYKRQT